MLSDCLKCREKADSKNRRVVKVNKGRLMILPKCAVCDSKNSRFIKEQGGLLSTLGIKTGLDKIPLFGPFLF